MCAVFLQAQPRGRRTGRADRPHVRRGLAAPDRADDQLRHRLRAAVLARLQADPADARRSGAQQIAQGLANAEKIKAELAKIEAERQRRAGGGRTREARAADRGGARGGRARPGRGNAEGDRRRRADPRRRRARPPRGSARRCSPSSSARSAGWCVQTTATVTGKILTPEDHRRLAEETAPRQPGGREGHDDETEQTTRARGAAAVPPVPRGGRLARRGPRPRRGRDRVIRVAGAAARSPSSPASSGWCGSIASGTPRVVESAVPLPDDVRADVAAGLDAGVRRGASRRRSQTNPALIGGHAHQGRQRRVRRQRAGPAGRDRGAPVSRPGPSSVR